MGDFNGDGFDDIAIGAPLADYGGQIQAPFTSFMERPAHLQVFKILLQGLVKAWRVLMEFKLLLLMPQEETIGVKANLVLALH